MPTNRAPGLPTCKTSLCPPPLSKYLDMAARMDVVTLFTQMQDTLSTINTTLASLNTSDHDAKLDELEQKRDDAIRALCSTFAAESEFLDRKRKAERDEIAEKRRREDEELAARDHKEDEERNGKLKLDTDVIEQDTDCLMSQVEEEARVVIEEGREKLKDLEARRRVGDTTARQALDSVF